MPQPIDITNPASLPHDADLKCAASLQTLLVICQRYGGAKKVWHLKNATNELWYAEVTRNE